MTTSLLLTQCIQNDFVMPIGRFDPIPNRLHVGFSEARRLMGENPSEGPVARVMQWAYGASDEKVRIVHIRDWHNPDDPEEREHLEQFGHHCIQDSEGARFAFQVPGSHNKQVSVVDSITLNDFHGTSLADELAPFADTPRRVGIMGVWTEAKVSFLAYELKTRYPGFDVAVCSALAASSSKQHHFEAIDQLQRILGVRICDSVGDFLSFLGGGAEQAPLVGIKESHPELLGEGLELSDADRTLTRYLFRDCRTVELEMLTGGFSGNVVASAQGIDLHGHDQVPHVVKIGPRDLMGQERTSFERVQDVLGNNAPQIAEFADFGDRGAIKYRYASMGGSFSETFQKQYMGGVPLETVQRVIDTVFGEQLYRLYKAATLEECDLLEHYMFSDRWAPSVRKTVEEIIGRPATEREIELIPGESVPNICDFYESTLRNLPRRPGDRCYQAYVHGDLNGANIILDDHENVWLIDFFHTRRAHVLMDLIKLENDLLFIYTPIETDDDLRQAFRLTDALMEVRDLAAVLPEKSPSRGPVFERAWATVRMLRSHYPRLIHADRDPFQLWIAVLRYAVHTLTFFESDDLQKKWALYTAARCVERISAYLKRSTELRLDFVDAEKTRPGRLAMTLLPGRKDYHRDLSRDLEVLEREDVSRVLCLISHEELDRYGVKDLLPSYLARGMETHHLPIVDQRACSVEDMKTAVSWIEEGLAAGETVLLHCVGGLGRTGMAAACLLKSRGLSSEDALAEVRRARSPRAVETAVQEALVRQYSGA